MTYSPTDEVFFKFVFIEFDCRVAEIWLCKDNHQGFVMEAWARDARGYHSMDPALRARSQPKRDPVS